MNKYTDSFFEFPIRIYDSYSARRAEKETEDTGERVDPLWVTGKLRIAFEEILRWHEFYWNSDIETVIAEEKRQKGKGLDCTVVITRDKEEYICPLTISQFEEKLNKFVEKMDAEIEEMYDEETELNNRFQTSTVA